MRYRAIIRFQGKGVLPYYGAPFVSPSVAWQFNKWDRTYQVGWSNVNQFMPTWALQQR